MVRSSHVATEFIYVATRNGHCASGKLVAIRMCARQRRSTAQDRGALLPMTKPGAEDRHARATGMRAQQRHERDRGILLQQRFLCCDRLV